MRVAILGCGATGSAIARILKKEKFIDEIVCLDKNVKRAKKFLGKETFEIKKVDARNQGEISKVVKECDWIINALPTAYYPRGKEVLWNPKIMKIALKTGINYFDLACYGGKSTKAEQLKYEKKFEQERILGIINAGASPGLTNLLAKENSEGLELIDKILIRTLEEQRGSEFILPWSKEEMLDIVSEALVFSNRKFKFKEPFSEVATYDYSLPFGRMYCYLVSHDEAYTIPHFIPVRSLDVKAAGSDIEILRTLFRLRIFEDEPIYFNGKKILPRDFVYSIIPDVPTSREMIRNVKSGVIEDGFFGVFVDTFGEAIGRKTLVRSYVVFPSQKTINNVLPGATYITYPTAVCAIAIFKAIYKKRIYGVFPPETFAKKVREKIISELEKRKIVISSEYKILS